MEKGKVSRITAVARNLGNRDQAWNTRFAHNQTYLGVWVFLDKEPTYNNKKRYENWSDIEGIFPTGFDIFFSKFYVNTPLYKLVPKSFSINILFAIGYKIPKEFGNYELHWDLALFPKSLLKNKQKRILNFNNMNKITWVKTLNSSYTRFFGRGAFCNTIYNSKIMVIGVGAIGSSLSEILVRGGVKEICLVDNDNIEPGNICRSKYTFNNIGISKIHELKAYLASISPFVNVATKFGINVISKYNSRFNDLRNEISQYDLVFDCTANGEIGHLLQSMNISNTVIHICITDQAKEMLFISNSDNENANERRNQMLYALGSFQLPGFREGVGCWHPTFEASFFDINQMLNYALKKMNDLYKVQKPINSFYVLCKNGLLASIDDVKYYQPDLKLSITITSNCLDKIYDLVWHFYPNEFGGVFVGNYINDNKEVIISDIITSNRFKNSQSRFEPDHKDLSQKINDLYETNRGQLIYIGDWHSHPNGNNMYSPPDYDSIRRVAYYSTVNTKNPLLMIAAFGRNYFDPGFYVFFEGRLYKYEKKNK